MPAQNQITNPDGGSPTPEFLTSYAEARAKSRGDFNPVTGAPTNTNPLLQHADESFTVLRQQEADAKASAILATALESAGAELPAITADVTEQAPSLDSDQTDVVQYVEELEASFEASLGYIPASQRMTRKA